MSAYYFNVQTHLNAHYWILILKFVQLFSVYWMFVHTRTLDPCFSCLYIHVPRLTAFRIDRHVPTAPYAIAFQYSFTSAAYLGLWLYSVIKYISVPSANTENLTSLNKHPCPIIYDVDWLKLSFLLRTA